MKNYNKYGHDVNVVSLFYVHGYVHHKTILQMSNEVQQKAVFILFYCNIPLHVSDAFCIHHQEDIKL
jgi:hypothetical protein